MINDGNDKRNDPPASEPSAPPMEDGDVESGPRIDQQPPQADLPLPGPHPFGEPPPSYDESFKDPKIL